MDIERAKRYKDKLNSISERLADVQDWTSGYDISDFISDKRTRLAVYKAFQELIEASFDIVAMMCKDSRIIPKDDYTNLEEIHNRKIIQEHLKNVLTESNGLRNRLVHRYNTLDDRIAFEAIQVLLPGFRQFIEVMDGWLRENQ